MSEVRVILQRDSEREERVVTTGTTAAALFEGERAVVAARVGGDQGAGLAPAAREALFQPFARPPESEQGGIGLGLSIVRAIVERHGGTVGVESEAGHGATFWFTLPLADEVAQP